MNSQYSELGKITLGDIKKSYQVQRVAAWVAVPALVNIPSLSESVEKSPELYAKLKCDKCGCYKVECHYHMNEEDKKLVCFCDKEDAK